MRRSDVPVIYEFNPPADRVRALLRKAGKKFGSVYFEKKNGEMRKMCYRVGVSQPSCAAKPKGIRKTGTRSKSVKMRGLMTVLDANKVVRDKEGNKVGRGAWRNIPLNRVREITAGGTRYKISR